MKNEIKEPDLFITIRKSCILGYFDKLEYAIDSIKNNPFAYIVTPYTYEFRGNGIKFIHDEEHIIVYDNQGGQHYLADI